MMLDRPQENVTPKEKTAMMRQYELVERVAKFRSNVDEALLNKAYVYAMQKHGQQTRKSGAPYFSHPLEVAAICADLRLDEETIAVALLHDTIEDTDATRKEIDELFGPRIGLLVEGLTKIKKIDLVSQKAKQAENLRRLMLAISDDIRVLLVKLADRLHNMRTLEHMRRDKQVRISTETMEIYAPLAGRMGMQEMRDELEELSFKYMHPDTWQMVTTKLENLREKNRDLVATISNDLAVQFKEEKIEAEVRYRQKKAYSVFRKMESKSLGFEQLSDIFGFRVLVKNKENCYRALGVIHTSYPMVPDRFKDFISTPKQNDYRSIHTTVIGPSRQRVELQIRTFKMHEIAEYGVAAHALYKDKSRQKKAKLNGGKNGDSDMDPFSGSAAYASLRKTIDQLAHGDDAEEFLEHTKLELFLDQVFCFTPKGRIIALPKGATPIDFAYAVHTDVGNSCVGSKVNGNIVPVMTKLENGDEVEIVCSKAQTPPASWESVAVTGKARSAIRRANKIGMRKQYSGLGKRMLERAFERAKREYSTEQLEAALARLARSSTDDVLADVGRGEISTMDVISAVYPDYKDERATPPAPREEGWFGLRTAAGMAFRIPGMRNRLKRRAAKGGENAVPIRGVQGDLPVRFAREGGAVPGDRIVGIVEPGKGITVYPIQSNALIEFEDKPDQWLDVRWDIGEDNHERFPATIKLLAINEPGTLAEIAAVIALNDANIQSLEMHRPVENSTEMMLGVEVWDLNHLTRIIKQLAISSSVYKVERIFG